METLKRDSNSLDLTVGSVRAKLIQYAVPLVIMNLMQSLYSMVDLVVSGYFIGSRGISGINNSSQIMLLLTQIIIGLSQGGNILISQFFGAKKEEERKQTTNTLFFSFMVLSVIMAVAVYGAAGHILTALSAPAYKEALAYLRICSIGFIFIFGYNALVAAVRGVGDSRHPMNIIIIATLTNVVLDLLFVGGFHMGTGGAAAATVISQGISFLLIALHVGKNKDIFGISFLKPGYSWAIFRKILKLGIPCAVQMSLAGISWLTVTKFINSYGVAASAGGGVSAKIKDFCQLFITAMNSAAASMTAQTLGAGKTERAREVLYTAMKITLAVAAVLIIIVEVFAPLLVRIFTQDPDAAGIAVLNLRIEIIGQLFYAVFMIYHGFAVGAGHTWFVLMSSFVNCILVRVILVVALNPLLGLTGIFLACMIAPASSIPLGIIYERSGVWKRSILVKQQGQA